MSILQSTLKLTLLDEVSARAKRIQGALAGFQRNQAAFAAPFQGIAAQALAFGGAYLGIREGVSGTIGAAIKFESAFADVRKVVDATDEQFQNMERSIKDMSRQLPLSATEIAALYAAAGESGVATSDLKTFSEMAARVGIAFDMGAGEAGESLAKLKTQLGLNVAETGDMADAINHLSNNMASKAKDITAYMLRVGALAEMGGFAKEEIAAVGSAMIAAGAEAEVAGTAMQNVVKALTRGASAKKSQKDAAKALGLHLPTIAKDMQKDAKGTMKKVLTAIAKAPKDQHISLLSDFFGDEAKAFAPLVGNIKLLDQALDSVADRTQYAGSAFREYVARASTVENALQILRNKFAYVFEDIGKEWLPTVREGVEGIGHVLDTLGERASIFDEIGTGMKGFMQGLGYDSSVREMVQDLGDLLFGEVDGDGAADKLGRIFKQFEGYGESIRKLKEDLQDNPIAIFLAEIAGQGFKLMLASVGIGVVAGAIMKLGRAVAFLSGITTALGILKTVGRLGGILRDVPVPRGTNGSDGRSDKNGQPKTSSWGTGWKSFLAAFQMADAVAGIPSTAEGVEELYRKNRDGASNLNKWLDDLITTPSEFFQNQIVPLQPPAEDDGGRAASMDAYLDGPERMPAQSSSPTTVEQMLSGLQGKPVILDNSTISQLMQPTQGVQDVRVTNKEPPNVTVNAPITIMGVSSPEAAAEAAISQLGRETKAAVEAAHSD